MTQNRSASLGMTLRNFGCGDVNPQVCGRSAATCAYINKLNR